MDKERQPVREIKSFSGEGEYIQLPLFEEADASEADQKLKTITRRAFLKGLGAGAGLTTLAVLVDRRWRKREKEPKIEESLPTPIAIPSPEKPTPAPEPTLTPTPTPEPAPTPDWPLKEPDILVPTVERLSSFEDLQRRLMEEDAKLGVNIYQDPPDEIRKVVEEKRSPRMKSVRLVVSESAWNQITYSEYGTSFPEMWFSAHVAAMNDMFRVTQVPYRVQLRPILVVPDKIVSSWQQLIVQSGWRGHKLGNDILPQSAADDIFWVFDRDYSLEKTAYLRKVKVEGFSSPLVLDLAALHEWMHQLGVGDHYWQIGTIGKIEDGGKNPKSIYFLPDDLMSVPRITDLPFSSIYLKYVFDHDPRFRSWQISGSIQPYPFFSETENINGITDINQIIANRFSFRFQGKNGEDLTQKAEGSQFLLDKDENNGFKREPFILVRGEEGRIEVGNPLLKDSLHILYHFRGFNLPIPRGLLNVTTMFSETRDLDVEQKLDIVLLKNPDETLESPEMFIACNEYLDGKPVINEDTIAYYRVPGTNYFFRWQTKNWVQF